MLFVIDKSIANALENGTKSNDDVVVAAESIALAHRRGYHLIFAERKTLNTLKECYLLSEVTRHVYARAYQRFPQTGEYRKKFVRRVDVVATESTFELNVEGKCKVIRLSANYISNSSIADETVFLSENQRDIRFYKKLAQAYIFWSGLGKIKLWEILHVSPDLPSSKYWLHVLKVMKIFGSCWSSHPCTDEKSCSCIVAHSLGDKILDAVIKVIQEKSDDEVARMVCELLKPEWENIGEIITAWCCGSSRLSVI